MKHRLIVCCDRTWQDLAQNYPTNVVKMTQAINGTLTILDRQQNSI
mgnify:CR=1|jgi:uncharacterized protein (DUF2235 family)